MNLPPEEQERLATFSQLIQEEEMEKALAFARTAIEDSATHAGLWHNQAGALVFEFEDDQVRAFEHYHQSLQLGFDANICEENMWEAAEVFFLSLRTEEGTFNAILTIIDQDNGEKAHESLRANHLLKKYKAVFPEGQFTAKAKEYLAAFEAATEG